MADKTIKVIALTTTQQILISEVIQVAAMDIGEPDCKLVTPFIIKEDGTLEPYLLSVTQNDIFMMSSDKILTLAEPSPTILEKYLDLTEE